MFNVRINYSLSTELLHMKIKPECLYLCSEESDIFQAIKLQFYKQHKVKKKSWISKQKYRCYTSFFYFEHTTSFDFKQV